MEQDNEHILVIGGSGMLSTASIWLANQRHKVAVIGRSLRRLNSLVAQHHLLKPIQADYSNLDDFGSIIGAYIEKEGHFNTVIGWIHNNESEVLQFIQKMNSNKVKNFYHVLGSSSNLAEIKKRISLGANIKYIQIQLGFKSENGRSRWLTHEEISNGVITAIKNEQDVLVGQLEPWDQRP